MQGYKIIFVKNSLGIPIHSFIRSGLSIRSYWPEPRYYLSKDEVASFCEFWRGFASINLSKSPLNVAIRRFNLGYERDNKKDKLVDYMITFEAFFSTSDYGELSHKRATRVAHLLKNSFEDRKGIFKEVKKFYDKRSQVVHGKDIQIDDILIDNMEKYLRDSIRIFLNKVITEGEHKDFIQHLDLA